MSRLAQQQEGQVYTSRDQLQMLIDSGSKDDGSGAAMRMIRMMTTTTEKSVALLNAQEKSLEEDIRRQKRAIAQMEEEEERLAAQHEEAIEEARARIEQIRLGPQGRVTNERQSIRKRALTVEEEETVQAVLWTGAPHDVVIEKHGFSMTRDELRCTRNDPHPVWLKDEVINFTMKLLEERERRFVVEEKTEKLRVWFLNSFFFTKLLNEPRGNYCYANVRRWSKRAKIDIFAPHFRMMVIPINIRNTHWTLLVADFKKREVLFIDSMAGGGKVYRDAFLRFLADEHEHKKKAPLPQAVLDTWTTRATGASLPQQRNGSDCGVFAVHSAIYLTDPWGPGWEVNSQERSGSEEGMGIPLEFGQEDMPYFRKRMLLDIINGRVE
eukprot:g4986.t1